MGYLFKYLKMVIFHGYVKYTKSTMGIQWNVGGYFWFSAPSMLSNLVLFVGCCVRYMRCIYLFRKCVNFLETTWESRIEESDCILRRKHRKPYHDWWLSICIGVRECKQTNTCHTNDFMCMYIYIQVYTHTYVHMCYYVCVDLDRHIGRLIFSDSRLLGWWVEQWLDPIFRTTVGGGFALR